MNITSNAAAVTVPVVKKRAILRRDDGWAGWLFSLPHLVLFATFLLAPTLYGFFISLHRWQILAKTHPLVGFANYSAVLSDDIFWMALRNTAYFVLLVVPLGNLVSLLLALALSQVKAFATFYKVAFYIPVVISISVVAILWQWLYNTEVGLLNLYLGTVVNGLRHAGMPLTPFSPLPWLSNPKEYG